MSKLPQEGKMVLWTIISSLSNWSRAFNIRTMRKSVVLLEAEWILATKHSGILYNSAHIYHFHYSFLTSMKTVLVEGVWKDIITSHAVIDHHFWKILALVELSRESVDSYCFNPLEQIRCILEELWDWYFLFGGWITSSSLEPVRIGVWTNVQQTSLFFIGMAATRHIKFFLTFTSFNEKFLTFLISSAFILRPEKWKTE